MLADPVARIHATYEATVGHATSNGTYDQSGRDFHLVLTNTIEGVSFTVEQLVSGEQSYLLTPGRPWVHDVVVSGADRAPTMAEALESVEARAAGTAVIEGATVERYDLDGLKFADLTASMGLSDPGATVTGTTSALFASPDGRPVALDLAFTSSTSDGTPYVGDYRFTFASDGAPASIKPPADPWVQNADGHGYSILYPEAWQATPGPQTADGDFKDTYQGPDTQVVVYCVPKAKLGLKDWTASGIEYYSAAFGGKPDATGEETVGGLPARWTRWDDSSVDGDRAFIVNIALVKGPMGCDIQWFRAPGPTGSQDDVFTTVWGTFHLN